MLVLLSSVFANPSDSLGYDLETQVEWAEAATLVHADVGSPPPFLIGAADVEPLSQETAERFPFSTTVKLEMNWGSVSTVCSGVLVHDAHVLTAGHCIYDHALGGWAPEVRVIPGLTGTYQPFGSAQATVMHTYSGWADQGLRDYDFALIALDRPLGKSQVAGSLMVSSYDDASYSGLSLNMNHYPAAAWGGGTTMHHSYDEILGVQTHTFHHALDSTGGSSGGGMYTYNADTGERLVHAVNVAEASIDGVPSYNISTRVTLSRMVDIRRWVMEDPVPQDLADLAPQGVSAWQNGDWLQLQLSLANVGTLPVDGVEVAVRVQGGPVLHTATLDLDPFVDSQLTVDEFIGDLEPGTWWIEVAIDPDNAIAEWDEMDNTFVVGAVVIQAPENTPDDDPWGSWDTGAGTWNSTPEPSEEPQGGCSTTGGVGLMAGLGWLALAAVRRRS